MDAFLVVCMVIGLFLLARRLTPPPAGALAEPTSWPSVSIVVPARNEEPVIGRLLASLKQLDYPSYEVIVVNDRSTDATGAVARGFAVTVVEGQERPQGWGGKQWAAWQGAEKASGEYVLFTDADTWHHPHSLKTAVAAAVQRAAALTTALPFHACETLWERLMGPFHVLLLSATKPFGKPRGGQLFAIGQYLLFRRADYAAIGGHAAVRAEIVEDVPLGMRVIASGRTLHVAPVMRLYEVRMYQTLRDFYAGWRRNFRAGMASSSPWVTAEIVLMIATLIGGLRWAEPMAWGFMAAGALAVFFQQRRIGSFEWAGAVMGLFGVGVFTWISCVALLDRLRKQPIKWKGRSYEVSPAG